MTLDELTASVTNLALPEKLYLLFGSAPLLAHGLVDSVNDLDILATGDAWAYAITLAEVQIAAAGDPVVKLADDIDIYGGWLGRDVAALFERSRFIGGFRYASLEDVLAYKRMLNRPKDQEHIALLEHELTVLDQVALYIMTCYSEIRHLFKTEKGTP